METRVACDAIKSIFEHALIDAKTLSSIIKSTRSTATLRMVFNDCILLAFENNTITNEVLDIWIEFNDQGVSSILIDGKYHEYIIIKRIHKTIVKIEKKI